ncbi:hypothetical protein [Clostridium algidicarnis]|uniref:hypothetical protein n=1 Tax=Clostridium algidicarnis TaxID=37659 RepID=UPI0004983D78|nr:hypothetical protein [Clostridium algidicarnis]
MVKYITYSINTIEDVKMGSEGSQKDTEYALSYLAGSTLRGAYIGKYIRENKISEDISINTELRNKLLKNMKFLNAYPEISGKRALPFPCCFYANKDDIKSFNSSFTRIPLINEMEEEVIEEYKRFTGSEFCLFKDEIMQGINVDKVFNLHVNTRRDSENLFRYEAIVKGQTFKGIIQMSNILNDEIDQCVKMLDNSIFYLGGSKGSGYGKCIIKDVKVHSKNPEIINSINEEDFDGELIIYAASDIISRDKFGRYINYIEEDYLKDILQLETVKLQRTSVQKQIISGYNNKWRCRLPQIEGIKAGSIFKYQYTGDLKLSNISRLEEHSIGERVEEGYGRVIILDELRCNKTSKYSKNKESIKHVKLDEQDEKQLQLILDNIFKNSLEYKIDENILTFSQKFTDKLGRSQKGKLIENTINARNFGSKKGKEYFLNYFNHIETKQNNKNVLRQFEDSKVGNKSLLEYLKCFINKSEDVDEFKTKYVSNKEIDIFGIKPIINNEYVFNYNMQYLEKLFTFILRKEVKYNGN